MATFYYEAAQKNGSPASGTLEAADRNDAFGKLSKNGMQPFVLREGGAKAPSRNAKKEAAAKQASENSGPVKLSSKQVILFTEELSDLLAAGLQLEPALTSMEKRGELSSLKTATTRIREAVREGSSFSAALKHGSPSFGDLFCSLAAAGEVSGALPTILSRQAEHLKTLGELKGKVTLALIYPGFLFVSGIAVAVLFVTNLIPKLTSLVESMNSSLPPVAAFMVSVSDFAKSWWWLILAFVLGGFALFWQTIQTEKGREWWDEAKLKIPLTGAVLYQNFYVQFLETLANLVQNGLPLVKGIELVRNATGNLFLKSKLDKVYEEVSDGTALSRSLDRSEVFPKLLTDMVRIGEQTGNMGSSLAKAGERFDKELSRKIEKVSALIQPAIILMMAGIVGIMAYLMITIIYDTISTVRTAR